MSKKHGKTKSHRISIDVHDGIEALALTAALNDPQTRAFMLVVGSLLIVTGGNPPSLLGPEARSQALQYVHKRLDGSSGE